MFSLTQDLRYGLRGLAAAPGFTAVATLTLGLGIGASAAVFSLLDQARYQQLPVDRPAELRSAVVVSRSGAEMSNVPAEFFDELRRAPRSFAGVFACWQTELNFDTGDDPERMLVQYVSGGYYSTLGVRMVIGRPIVEADEDNLERVAILSHRFWRQRFGGDPKVLGTTVHLNGMPATIVGVTPAGFFGIDRGVEPEVTIPLPHRSPFTNLWVTARLRRNVPEAAAWTEAELALQRALETIRPRLGRYRESDRQQILTQRAGLRPADKGITRTLGRYVQPLTLLLLLSSAVLLIAGVNVANLLLTRTLARTREFGIRLALGASRARLLRQALTESILLAAFGTVAGLAMAFIIHPAIVGMLMQGVAHRALDFAVDGHLLVFSTAVATLTVLLCGLAPVLRVSRLDASLVAAANARRGRRTAARALVLVQLAVALVLLVGAGLLFRSFRTLNALDTGVMLDRMLTMRIGFDARETRRSDATEVYTRLVNRIEAIPGVVSAALGWDFALGGGSAGKSIWVEGQPLDMSQGAGFNVVGPRFFATAGIPVVRGREFTAADTVSARKVVVVNEAWVREYAGGRDPVGLHVGDEGADSLGKYEVVGVVRDSRTMRLRRAAGPMLYQPLLQDDWASNVVLHVRTQDDPWTLRGPVRAAIRALNPRLPVYDVTTLGDRRARALNQDLMMAALAGSLAAIALLLTVVGVYGVIAYGVAQRSVEIGIRMALGATERRVCAMVLRETLNLAALGGAIGLALSLAGSRVVESMLFGVTSRDGATLAASSAVLLLSALAAGYAPARRAARREPFATLRGE